MVRRGRPNRWPSWGGSRPSGHGFGVFAQTGYGRPVGAVADGPIVAREGTAKGLFGGLALNYSV